MFYLDDFVRFFNSTWTTFPRNWVSITTPDGYELVEKPEHRAERLDKEIESLKSRKEMLLNAATKCDELIKEAQKELKE